MAPPTVAAMRPTRVAARAATESGGATRSSIARRATRSESARARAARGSALTSKRAWSRNSFASATSSGAVTRPPRGATPFAYSFAASDAAATTRRATASESVAWAAAPAATQVLNSKPIRGLREMGRLLDEGVLYTRVIHSGIQADRLSHAPGPRPRSRPGGYGRATGGRAPRR